MLGKFSQVNIISPENMKRFALEKVMNMLITNNVPYNVYPRNSYLRGIPPSLNLRVFFTIYVVIMVMSYVHDV